MRQWYSPRPILPTQSLPRTSHPPARNRTAGEAVRLVRALQRGPTMAEAVLPDALQALVDKQAIYEVVLRGCRGGDRFDLDMIMSVFHERAQLHNVGGFTGSCEDLRAFL